MKIEIYSSFIKDIKKSKNKYLKSEIKKLIEFSQTISQINQIPNLKKIVGFKNFYRIRINDYRIGIKIENDTIYFIRCLHRKDIYKNFP